MANRATIAVGQMRVGEEGYCALDAVYVAPSSPGGPEEGRDVAATALFLLPDTEVHSEPSPMARVRVQRLEEGLTIHLPSGEVASHYLRRLVPGSLQVVALP